MARLQYDPNLDYYTLLDTSPDADEATIQRLFRQKAKQLHPDVNPEQAEWATEQFQQINAAYRVLNDPQTRRQYDQLRLHYQTTQRETKQQAKTYVDTSTARTSPPPSWPHPPHQSTSYQRPVYVQQAAVRNPYRYLRLFVGIVLLLNVGFIVVVLNSGVSLPFFSVATATPQQSVRNIQPTATMMPSPTMRPFEPMNTCTNPQATVLEPRSEAYQASDMPLPLSIRIALRSAHTYEIVLYTPDGLSITVKRPSAIQETFTGERLTLNNVDLQQWGVGDYRVVLTVFDQNQQEMVSCSVLVRYVEH